MQIMLSILAATALVIVILSGINKLEKRQTRRREIPENEFLFLLSRNLETSEFKLFCLAAEAWKISRHKVEEDFRAYLFTDRIPYYVRDFVRKVRRKMAENGMVLTRDICPTIYPIGHRPVS